MSAMLASVSSLQEALAIQAFAVDVIDLKQPAHGALGALAVTEVTTIIKSLTNSNLVSATIGDLPMQPDILFDAVQSMAHTGVDYIKIGFFPDGDCCACVRALNPLTAKGHALIAVLFADTKLDFSLISTLAHAGFKGVMLDTMNKEQGSLTSLLSQTELKQFVRLAKDSGLLVGLAGSLTKTDIPVLLPLQADYLGFRGALCKQSRRTAELDPERITEIRQLLTN